MNTIPEWVTWIGAGIGAMIAAIVIRLGWKSGGGQKLSESKPFVMDAALIDSKAANLLAGSIEGLTLQLQRMLHDAEKDRKVRYEIREETEMMTKQLNDLRHVLNDLSNQIARASK